MRYLFIITIAIGFISCSTMSKKNNRKIANNPVVAHRGAWKTNNLPENSIASLKQAIKLNCTGSEFDVRMTADSVLIIMHNKDYHDLLISETTYQELARFKLSNGETVPTLREYILAGMQNNPGTGLVCEIKPTQNKELDLIIAEKTVAMVKELKAGPYIHSYISFGYDILKKVLELDPLAKTQYLDGTITPQQLKEDGIWGLDYHMNVFKKNPDWIKSAKELGLSLNVWTVNAQEDLDWALANEFDFITTNEPELLFASLYLSRANY